MYILHTYIHICVDIQIHRGEGCHGSFCTEALHMPHAYQELAQLRVLGQTISESPFTLRKSLHESNPPVSTFRKGGSVETGCSC